MSIFTEQNNVFNSLKSYNDQLLNNTSNGASSAYLKSQISNLETAINTLKSSPGAKTHAEYDKELIKLLDNYKKMVNQRADLDLRLEELYDYSSSKRALTKRELDSSMYANILWTVIATIIVYVIFVYL